MRSRGKGGRGKPAREHEESTLKSFVAGPSFEGRVFKFDLQEKQLELHPIGKVRCYWMPIPELRRGECRNYRNCVDAYHHCAEVLGWTERSSDANGESENTIETLTLAELYKHVCRSKGQQDVFDDAFLRRAPGETESAAALPVAVPEEEANRLQRITESRDIDGIRSELSDIFAGELPVGEERARISKVISEWLGRAAEAFRAGGSDKLRGFVSEELAPELKRRRRRGGAAQLINLITYNAKVRFYTTYANAWIGLIHWLRAERDLNLPSEHLLRLFHSQNPNECAGQDVFWGQVLALHPISGRLMMNPDHQIVLGGYLQSVAHVRQDESIDNAANPAYWKLVEAILIASHQYRTQRAEQTLNRRRSGGTATVELHATRDDSPIPEATLFEDYAVRAGLTCPACAGNDLSYQSHEPQSNADDAVRITYQCNACGRTREEYATEANLRSDSDK